MSRDEGDVRDLSVRTFRWEGIGRACSRRGGRDVIIGVSGDWPFNSGDVVRHVRRPGRPGRPGCSCRDGRFQRADLERGPAAARGRTTRPCGARGARAGSAPGRGRRVAVTGVLSRPAAACRLGKTSRRRG